MQKNKSNPNIKHNTIANYVGKIYIAMIQIVMYPFYLKYLGPEAYGIIGFFVVIQTVLNILDMGMTPMLSRQIAATRGNPKEFLNFRKFLRSVEIIFFIIAIIIVITIFCISGFVAEYWFNAKTLSSEEISYCLTLMGVIIALNWLSSIYSSVIVGLESQIWLNGVSIVMHSLKFIGIFLVLEFISTEPSSFLEYQLLVACISPIILGLKVYSSLPKSKYIGITFSYHIIRPALPFGLSVAYTSAIWILFTQLDKIILSGIIPLEEYGYFVLISNICGGIMSISSPIGTAILPRMTFLVSNNKKEEMLTLYRKSTQLISAVMVPITIMIAFFGYELVYSWTGNREAAAWVAPSLFWYVLGYGFLSITALQYYMQCAYGNLKLHVILNTIFVMISIPTIYIVAYRYGVIGTSIAWFILQSIVFIIWPALVHKKFAPRLHRKWLMNDIAPIFISAIIALIILIQIPLDIASFSRIEIFLILIIYGIFVLAAASSASSFVRNNILYIWHNIRKKL